MREGSDGPGPAWWLPFGRVPEIAPEALARRLAEGGDAAPQLLDVRSGPEFRAGRIAGAVNVSIVDLPGRVGDLPFDRDRPVVAVCLSAHRSIPAVRLLAAAGFRDVAQLAGGMLAWRRAGLPEAR